MNKPNKVRPEPAGKSTLRLHTRDVLKGSAAAAVAKVATTVIGLGFNLVLARQLGAEQTGVIFIAIALATVASILSRVGLDIAVVKFSSRHAAAEEWPAVKAVYVRTLYLTFIASMVFVCALFLSADWLANIAFSKPDLAVPLKYISLSVLPLSLLNVHAQFLKSIRLVGVGFFLQNSAVSGICLLALLAAPAVVTVTLVAEIYLFAACAGAVFIAALWLRVSGLLKVSADKDYQHREMATSRAALFVVAIMNQIILPWGALLLLGLWGTEAEVGQFGIVRRLAMLINFSYLAVESITGPKFSALFAAGDLVAVEHVARRAALVMILVAVPPAALFVLAPEWVLSWFAPEFRSGAPLLVILAVGQMINVLTGSVINLLVMGGYEQAYRNMTILAALANVLLCIALIPTFGALGAAWATAVAVAVLNLGGFFIVRWKLGFFPFPGFPAVSKP
ncbi:MAG: oligosaccharide flippase family protein [Gammaproteobacteria bacterium]|jgi:O-antigen/teichoic acid export membrane protein|nr:oligosaccharide flippase family protein [Gammaproteobacteria bacterium]